MLRIAGALEWCRVCALTAALAVRVDRWVRQGLQFMRVLSAEHQLSTS
jgi:hypothetical protein